MQSYKASTFLSIFSAVILACAFILSGKVILIFHYVSTAGALVLPLWFVLNDIIAEVYGYKFSRNLFWYTMFSLFTFCALVTILVYFPSPQGWRGENSYKLVLGDMFYYFLVGFFSMIIAGFINIYAVSKWKTLVHGRYFWLRSIGASGIGEAIYSVLASSVVFLVSYLSPIGVSSLNDALSVMVTAFFFKISFSVILALPANMIVMVLKRVEGVDNYDYSTDFNPFKLT
ncbi:MAG: hypothetical protein K0S08_2128 [Gammaproteobacteria bacterium]|jgi:uncharacterized integral membrane protein (TIGR00697 family)|nr:hypothetical protein [Gammaproteobacteria bacterium]